MTSWDDPDHLPQGPQTGRVQAWRDEERIWVYRTRIDLMQRFQDRPIRFAVVTIVLLFTVFALLTVLSAAVSLHPLAIPGAVFSLVIGGAATWHRLRSSGRPSRHTRE